MKYTTNNIPRPWLTYSDMDKVQQAKLEKAAYDDPENFSISYFVGFEYQGRLYPFKWFLKPSGPWSRNDGYCYPHNEAASHLRLKMIDKDETVIVERLKK